MKEWICVFCSPQSNQDLTGRTVHLGCLMDILLLNGLLKQQTCNTCSLSPSPQRYSWSKFQQCYLITVWVGWYLPPLCLCFLAYKIGVIRRPTHIVAVGIKCLKAENRACMPYTITNWLRSLCTVTQMWTVGVRKNPAGLWCLMALASHFISRGPSMSTMTHVVCRSFNSVVVWVGLEPQTSDFCLTLKLIMELGLQTRMHIVPASRLRQWTGRWMGLSSPLTLVPGLVAEPLCLQGCWGPAPVATSLQLGKRSSPTFLKC